MLNTSSPMSTKPQSALRRSALLVVAAEAEARGDAIGGRDEVRPERVDQLGNRDHRAGHGML